MMNEGTTEPRVCRFCGLTVGVITRYDDGTCTWTGTDAWASALDGAPMTDYRCKEHARAQRAT